MEAFVFRGKFSALAQKKDAHAGRLYGILKIRSTAIDGRRFLDSNGDPSPGSEVVLMDMQTTIELIALVVSAIGLGIYIGRKK